MYGREKTLRVHAWCKRLTFLRLLGFRCVRAILPRGSFLIRSGPLFLQYYSAFFTFCGVGLVNPFAGGGGGRSDSPSLTHTRPVCSEAPGHKVLVIAIVSVVLQWLTLLYIYIYACSSRQTAFCVLLA